MGSRCSGGVNLSHKGSGCGLLTTYAAARKQRSGLYCPARCDVLRKSFNIKLLQWHDCTNIMCLHAVREKAHAHMSYIKSANTVFAKL